jgi:hypothetical protein
MYSDDGCMQKQADDGWTKLAPAYPYNLKWDGAKYVSHTQFEVRPAGTEIAKLVATP